MCPLNFEKAKIKFVNILELDPSIKEKVRQWRNQDDVREQMLNQEIISTEEHAHWLDSLEKRGDCKFWVVFYSDVAIGTVQLQKINHEQFSSEWGFYIGEDQYRGKGLGSYILFKLLNLFFEEMNFDILLTKVLSQNKAALRIYHNFCFKEIGRTKFDEEQDVVYFEFTKEDWLKYKKNKREHFELEIKQ